MASAVFSGSCTSRGGGALDVLIAQNRHPRVQVSPISCDNYEHPSCGPDPATHHDRSRRVALVPSPALANIGTARFLAHGAGGSSAGPSRTGNTHCRPSPLRSFLILLYDADVGTDVLRYDGSRGLPRRQLCRAARMTHDFIRPKLIISISPSGAAPGARKSSSAALSLRRAARRGRCGGAAVARVRLRPLPDLTSSWRETWRRQCAHTARGYTRRPKRMRSWQTTRNALPSHRLHLLHPLDAVYTAVAWCAEGEVGWVCVGAAGGTVLLRLSRSSSRIKTHSSPTLVSNSPGAWDPTHDSLRQLIDKFSPKLQARSSACAPSERFM